MKQIGWWVLAFILAFGLSIDWDPPDVTVTSERVSLP